ncbi:NUDIX domain-containing protein [Carboxylicivirga sediminis]|uniref:NUDIX domain-containing protein n=1 Tax=Carboxylicivirga sediminis TaxID=2006564 RepID=A0A941F9W4_9BACT|nr:NUDIX domain-containing protein [Carboxylicivirga sediminis]MBR8537715.1 NUDIX domain-containing protein [Carboxylicivirga sediminis]
MNKAQLLKQLLPGFLPIIVFIIVDEIWGTIYGLIVAIIIGISELLIEYTKSKKLERFILVDVGLIIALGLVSILLDNELFFMLKPGIISLIMTGLVGFSVFTKQNLMLQMSQRYMKKVTINPYQVWLMQQSMKRIFWLLLVYSLATIAASFLDDTRLWKFLASAGFIVVAGIFLAFEWWQKKRESKQLKQDEWLPLISEDGQIIGSAPRSHVHKQSFLLHPVVHLHVVYNQQILLQKRPAHKLVQPGKWDTAVGGHVSTGESIELALQRETLEEIGLENFKAQAITRYIWESPIEKEMVFVFKTAHKGPFRFDEQEVDEVRFWSIDEINKQLGKGIFTPNFEHEFERFRDMLI